MAAPVSPYAIFDFQYTTTQGYGTLAVAPSGVSVYTGMITFATGIQQWAGTYNTAGAVIYGPRGSQNSTSANNSRSRASVP